MLCPLSPLRALWTIARQDIPDLNVGKSLKVSRRRGPSPGSQGLGSGSSHTCCFVAVVPVLLSKHQNPQCGSPTLMLGRGKACEAWSIHWLVVLLVVRAWDESITVFYCIPPFFNEHTGVLGDGDHVPRYLHRRTPQATVLNNGLLGSRAWMHLLRHGPRRSSRSFPPSRSLQTHRLGVRSAHAHTYAGHHLVKMV